MCPGKVLGWPRGSWIKVRKGCLGCHAYPAAAESQTQIRGREWMEGVIERCVVVAAATAPLCYLYTASRPCRAQYSVRLEAKAATGPGPGKCGAISLYSVPVMLIHRIPLEEVKTSWASSPGKIHARQWNSKFVLAKRYFPPFLFSHMYQTNIVYNERLLF